MAASVLTAANWPIVGQLCKLLGIVMNAIYLFITNNMGIHNGAVGISIIVYTIVVYTLMIPLTVQQQKTAKMTAVINPEVQAIQKKYKNKKDQASMMKQQDEIQRVYDKYGTSMMGGCLPLLIQMPFLFALYPVIYSINDYVPALKDAPASVQRFIAYPNLSMSPSAMIHNASSFEGISKSVIIIAAIALPLLSGASQWLNIQLNQAVSGANMNDKDNPMANSMKTMNTTMPLFSIFMVYTLPTGIGIYWFVSAIIRSIQQVIINKYLSKISLDELVEKNKEKAEKKAKKRSERQEKMSEYAYAQTNTKSLKSSSKISNEERERKLAEARQKNVNAKPGSLASKANMVSNYNNKKK